MLTGMIESVNIDPIWWKFAVAIFLRLQKIPEVRRGLRIARPATPCLWC